MRVLIVEDDPNMAEAVALTIGLHWPECEVQAAEDGAAALAAAGERAPDLVLLDLGLPRQDGFAVLRELRRTLQTPVMIITARGDEMDKVRGLELGADDYITKPFSHLELLARIKAVLRRTENGASGAEAGQSYHDAYLSLDFGRREMYAGGRPVSLTPTEFNLLAHLVRNAGRTTPHSLLLNRVWGPEFESESDYLRVYIRRLREKLEQDAENPRYILTDRGVGYRFRPGAADEDAGRRAA
ncbi:MAG: response regulator transcription factor [Chloroflexi bacterium]|nr:response regulator transcription factor [Chloroflexota bacterium]